MIAPACYVLGVETSCDETAAAVVEDGCRVRANVVASQIATHAQYGGVVPEVASRQHVATIVPVIERAIADAGVQFRDLDAIAVTAGPGLVGALLVGVETAKALAFALGKPLVAVNHLGGHLAAAFLEHAPPHAPPTYPHLALLVSGGHTALIRIDAPGATRLLGATRDDAAGEAFDKVGKMLGLGYPGGVAIDKLAATGDPRAVGAAARVGRARRSRLQLLGAQDRGGDAARPPRAAARPGAERFLRELSGRGRRRAGAQVAARARERGAVARWSCVAASPRTAACARRWRWRPREDGFALHIPPPKYCTDNAAMIAAAGTQLLARGARGGAGPIC